MEEAEKRVKKTIQKMPNHELYAFGDAGVLTNKAHRKVYTLEKVAKTKNTKV